MRIGWLIVVCAAAVIVLAMLGFGVLRFLHQPAGGRSPAAAGPSGRAVDSVPGSPAPQTAPSQVSALDIALQEASKQNRFTFVTFHQGNDAAGTQMISEVKAVVDSSLSSRAVFVSLDASDPANRGVVSRFGADRAAMPLTLVIAANGAVTAGYPKVIPSAVKEDAFADALASPGMAGVLKTLQSGKLAAVCFQNATTKYNKESSAAAGGLRSAKQFAGMVEIVKVDPTDPNESMLLKICGVDPATRSAQLVVIAPPGSIVGKFDGAMTTEAVVGSVSLPRGGS